MDAYIDPHLHTRSPSTPYISQWDPPLVQRYLEETQTTAYFNADFSTKASTNRAFMRPSAGIQPLPPPSHIRFASPISSIEPSSSSDSMRSPPADTESYHDGVPSTPPDTTLRSLYQHHLSFKPWNPAHVVQFTAMGGPTSGDICINPNDMDMHPSQLDYCESESSNTDFTLPQRGYSYESYAPSQCDFTEATSNSATTIFDLPVRRLESPDEMQPAVKEEIEASSQYPPLPPQPRGAKNEEDAVSDIEPAAAPASKRRKDDTNDGDYRPTKRQAPGPKSPTRGRGGPKPKHYASVKTRTVAPSSNTTSSQYPAPKALPPSTSSTKGAYSCSNCTHTPFKDQSSLDTHIKKQHTRPFVCVFHFAGCDSTFATKNEWKRHVSSQHLLLSYWLCQEGLCAKMPSPSTSSSATTSSARGRSSRGGGGSSSASLNPSATTTNQITTDNNSNGVVFNRKDLYTQHLRRMHMPPQVKKSIKQQHAALPSAAFAAAAAAAAAASSKRSTTIPEWEERLRSLQERALHERCKLPDNMQCPAVGCEQTFNGQEAWDQRMEHVARHLEGAAAHKEDPVVFGGKGDPSLVEWAARADVAIIKKKGGNEREGEWELNALLKRGSTGGVAIPGIVLVPKTVPVAPVAAMKARGVSAHDNNDDDDDDDNNEDDDG
ncbi:hypothetical protein B0T17DRAFT_50624 [Bombardia bombarda]|uniref:C2H2-type domain-containing protein n=1 Tax=Bombardia bombarda TaxID=252184 RepID=A0AA39XL52_9PEZI|nr:hypothetical protein B0T17DRAFT_50624 [Bombardia bombarda]